MRDRKGRRLGDDAGHGGKRESGRNGKFVVSELREGILEVRAKECVYIGVAGIVPR